MVRHCLVLFFTHINTQQYILDYSDLDSSLSKAQHSSKTSKRGQSNHVSSTHYAQYRHGTLSLSPTNKILQSSLSSNATPLSRRIKLCKYSPPTMSTRSTYIPPLDNSDTRVVGIIFLLCQSKRTCMVRTRCGKSNRTDYFIES